MELIFKNILQDKHGFVRPGHILFLLHQTLHPNSPRSENLTNRQIPGCPPVRNRLSLRGRYHSANSGQLLSHGRQVSTSHRQPEHTRSTEQLSHSRPPCCDDQLSHSRSSGLSNTHGSHPYLSQGNVHVHNINNYV